MKNLFNYTLKLVLFCSFILVLSCEKDLFDDAIYQQSKEIKIKTIPYEEFNQKFQKLKDKPKIDGLFFSAKYANFQAKAIDSSVVIYLDLIKEISKSNYTSYTMYMKTPKTTDNIFYNITIEDRITSTTVFITKYSTTNDWLKNQDRVYEGQTATLRVAGNFSTTVELQQYLEDILQDDDLFNNSTTINISGGGGSNSSISSEYPWGCDGTVMTTTISTPYKCGCGHWPWDSACHGCFEQEPKYGGFTYSIGYECVPNSAVPGSENSFGGNNNGALTGGGGSSNGSNGSTSNPNNSSISTIVGSTNPDCLPLDGDLNGDCVLDYNEAQFNFFHDNLTDNEQQIIDIRENQTLLFNYFVQNGFTAENKEFVIEVITQMILNPNVYTSVNPFLIEKKIDDSQLDPCTKGILNELKSLESKDIAKIFAKINANPIVQLPIYKTSIVIEDPINSPTAMAQTNWVALPNPNGGAQPAGGLVPLRFNYIIRIRPSYLDGSMLSSTNPPSKPTKLSIARTLLHEIIHAYFDTMFDDCYMNNNCVEIKQYPELWNAYVTYSNGGQYPANAQHLTIAKNFTNILARALQEYQTGNPVSDNVEPEQVYKDLAWQGLEAQIPTNIFNQVYPPGSVDLNRLHEVNNAEDKNMSYNSGTLITPLSTPCN